MSILMHGIQMPKSCSECKLDLRTDICKAFCEWSAEHPYSRRATDRLLDCPLSEVPEPCEDAVSRQAVSSWLKQYGQDVLHGKYKFSLMYIWKNLMDLPSAQPEIKPIDYQDCANAMLRMWMDKVVTDGEYNRIMDKLNAFWGTRNERSDRQASGD